MTTKKKKLAAVFAELEKLVNELETGDLDLETSLKKFRRGLALSAWIKRRLKEVENEIETLAPKQI